MKRFIVPLLILTLASCARISQPLGGPEDDISPSLVRSVPEQGQTNYVGNTVLLVFDEWVTTKNIETDLIITPKIQGGFKTRNNKNTVLLTFFEDLQDSTTYNFSFANTITDITNSNAAIGLSLSFSTGEVLDSLSISGEILNLYTQEPVEKLLVSLFEASDSTNILNGSAAYYTKTDTLGRYTFNNLPSGDFRIYATKDKNDNAQADSENEKYGFYPDTLRLNRSLQDIDFTIQNLNTKTLRTLSARPYAKYYDVSFNKPITNFNPIDPIADSLHYYQYAQDKVRIYPYETTLNDTTQLIFSATDSLNTQLLDTANLYFVASKVETTEFSYVIEPGQDALAPVDTLYLKFNRPIVEVNYDSLYFQLDSLTTLPIAQEDFVVNEFKTEFKLPIDFAELLLPGTPNVQYQSRPAAFISVDLDSSALEEKTIFPLKSDESAVINGTVISSSPNIIVQLLDQRANRIIRQSLNKQYVFDYLPAGRYQIRVIQDLNGNGKWDTGNILTNEPPEPAHFYYDSFYDTRVIEVRKNWEQTADVRF